MIVVVKEWTKPGLYLKGDFVNADGSKTPARTDFPDEVGTMLTIDHPKGLIGSGLDIGGPFVLERSSTFMTKSYWPRPASGKGYQGDVTSAAPSALQQYVPPSDQTLYARGSTAIAAVLPTEPEWSAATFLGETLQDGIPKMVGFETWREKTLRAKQAGGEYLNVQFGWLPLVSDITQFAYAVRNSSTIIQQYRDNANKKLRRRFRFPTVYSQITGQSNAAIRTAASYPVGSTMTFYYRNRQEETWFSGAFKYYLPVGNSAGERFQRYLQYADKLLGVKLTPEVLWNVAPWSWAVDWKTDVGDVVRNYSHIGHDGLVLQYGYVMNHYLDMSQTISRYGYTLSKREKKVRLPATPYGFGVDLSKLSSKQISILVALGLSRG